MRVLDWKVRGFRLVDLVALGLLIVLMLGVYLAKTLAGRERGEIARVEKQISQERQRVRLLEAEVAHLEAPARIERLSVDYLGMAPPVAAREIAPQALAEHAVEEPPKRKETTP
ncbi:MAG: cell division protein [Caulobacteraceae bacterium]|nr:cell division protein [Caulobacteraceae bacterium]